MQNSQRSSADVKQDASHHAHSKGLLTIGVFKLGKALVFFLLGMGALHFINADLNDTVQRAVKAFNFDPEGRFVSLLMTKVDLIDDHKLMRVSQAAFAYSAVATVEGVGLLLEQTWAEYLTLIFTMAFLPWEITELIRRGSLWYLAIIIINLAIVVYLLWFLRNYSMGALRKKDLPPV
ncbi:MAG: DUF2127 domain-containing protein [Acidobacteriaceae bacterium]|nr:DUF2127 domain-containing protein [Acidobacteriaceae bacterium]